MGQKNFNRAETISDQECLICYEKSSNVEIMCSGNHSYCIECFNSMYETMLLNNEKITNKCTLCQNHYFDNKMEAILKEDILLELAKRDIFSKFILPPNLSLMNCPVCPEKNA